MNPQDSQIHFCTVSLMWIETVLAERPVVSAEWTLIDRVLGRSSTTRER